MYHIHAVPGDANTITVIPFSIACLTNVCNNGFFSSAKGESLIHGNRMIRPLGFFAL